MDTGGDVYVEEMAINNLGYRYLGMGRIADAVAVLKLNVDVYPQSFNAHDSYAEALMKSGDKEGAIVHYKRSLELNPDNGNAREQLKSLE